MTTLSDHERRQLNAIEADTRTSDRKFADGLGRGRPRQPREYRRRRVLVVIAALAFIASMVTLGMPYVVLAALAGLITAGFFLRF